LLLWVDRRFSVPRGKLFALYVAAYTVGHGAVEALRVDHANHFLGLRLNDWTSLIVFLTTAAVLCWPRRQLASPDDAQPAIPRP
jgi:prolipoprotein diacylglyceryltransferase